MLARKFFQLYVYLMMNQMTEVMSITRMFTCPIMGAPLQSVVVEFWANLIQILRNGPNRPMSSRRLIGRAI
jgi:hypothetical protein